MENEKDTKKEDQSLSPEILEQIEKAAEKGAKSGVKKGNILSAIIPVIAVIAAVIFVGSIVSKINGSLELFKDAFTFESDASSHDLVIEDKGIFGYTVADFADAVLGESQRLKKIEVYQQEVSDVATLTNTGLFKLGAFTKAQYITYNGTAVYTVDLSKIKESDIFLNDENKTVLIKIPHAVQETINIPEDKIEFGDINKGLFAFGEMKMTPEQSSEIQSGAREKMEEKLDELNALETADRFAKLSVWEMYSPLIKSVAKNYSLEIEFK